MKKPEKFKDFIDALERELSRNNDEAYCEVMEYYGIKNDELDKCWDFLDYLYSIDEIPEQRTCHFNKKIFYECDACGWMSKEPNFVPGTDFRYCPVCGAKVVE